MFRNVLLVCSRIPVFPFPPRSVSFKETFLAGGGTLGGSSFLPTTSDLVSHLVLFDIDVRRNDRVDTKSGAMLAKGHLT